MISPNEAVISAYKMYDRRPYLNLFKVHRTGNSWGEPILDDSLKCECFVSHPTISPDGKLIIFSTDRFSENGDTDLWMAIRQDDGSWGAIVNLSELNSPGNEITPFFASIDTLYFSTDGQIGPGGYDIFFSVLSDGIWQRPKLLLGVNTEFDESDPLILPTKELIFASNRPGGQGKLDLYISRPISEKPIKPYVADIEIETFVPSIDLKIQSSYETHLLVPYVIIDNSSMMSNYFFGGINHTNKKGVLSADSIYVSSLGIIANRLILSKDSKLSIDNDDYSFKQTIKALDLKMDYDSNEELFFHKLKIRSNIKSIEDIQTILYEGFSIDDARILVNLTLQEESKKYFFIANSPEIYKPYKVYWHQVEMQPPILEFIVNANKENIVACDCYMIMSTDTFLIKSNIKEFPSHIQIPLKGYEKLLIYADLITIHIKCIYSDYIVNTRSVEIPIVKSKIEGRKTHKKGKNYLRYLFILDNIEDIDELPYYKSEFEQILKLASKTKRIDISYYEFQGKNEKAKINCELLANRVKNSMKNPPSININSTQTSDILEVSPQIAPYVIQVLIEN